MDAIKRKRGMLLLRIIGCVVVASVVVEAVVSGDVLVAFCGSLWLAIWGRGLGRDFKRYRR